MFQYLVILGAAVQLLGIFSYIKETLKGNTKPNRVSWLMWFVASTIATVAALFDGVRWAVLPVFISGFGPLLVFLASFINPNAYWKLEIFDYFCGFCSLLALVLWGITKEPAVAILFAIISDLFAGIPTIIKAWKHPETETVAAFNAGLFNALTSFAAIKVWNFSALAFPIYLVVINILFISGIYRRGLVGKAVKFLKESFIANPDYSFHDWRIMYNHSRLVEKFSRQIAKNIECDKLVLSLGALLHDIGKTHKADENTLREKHAELGYIVSKDFIDGLGLSPAQKETLIRILKDQSDLIEKKIIEDADIIAFYADEKLQKAFMNWVLKRGYSEDSQRKLKNIEKLRFGVSKSLAEKYYQLAQKNLRG